MLCLVPYPTIGASNRLRVEQYAPLLAAEGISLTISPFFDEETYRILYSNGRTVEKVKGGLSGLARRLRDALRASSYDLVLVHRESSPVPFALIERVLLATHTRYVLDFDDAIFLPNVHHPANRRWRWLRRPQSVIASARHATAVVVGNEYLASYARRWNASVTIIPTPVDTDRHRPSDRSPASRIVIGWVGSSTTAPYLHLVDRPLESVCRSRGASLCVVGGDYHNDAIERVEVRPYDLAREPDDLRGFDVGILPEPDNEWTRGKGAFKALLYMATGLPVVASAVGVNAEVVAHGDTGFCVRTDGEWRQAFERLADDPSLRARLGAAGRERAERLYSLRALAPRLARVLREAAA